jgi:hypothetical protein
VDRFFNKIRHCQHVATRDKLAANYLVLVQLAFIRFAYAIKSASNRSCGAFQELQGALAPGECSMLIPLQPGEPIFSLKLMPKDSHLLSTVGLVEQRNWVRFAKSVAGWLLSPRL